MDSSKWLGIVQLGMKEARAALPSIIVEHEDNEISFLATIARIRALELAVWQGMNEASSAGLALLRNDVDQATTAVVLAHIFGGKLSKTDAKTIFPNLDVHTLLDMIEGEKLPAGGKLEGELAKAYDTIRSYLDNRNKEGGVNQP